MSWNTDININKKQITTRLIIERAFVRGWEVQDFSTNNAIIFLYPEGRRGKEIRVFSATPSSAALVGAKIAKDKYITNTLLRQHGLPVPCEDLVRRSEELLQDAERKNNFLKKYKQLVVKPLDGSHGKGISTNVSNIDRLDKAIEEAQNVSSRILIQEQISGIDVRIVCINHQYVDAISRIPAGVTGDGVHTVEELIELVNQNNDRGKNYKTKFNIIPWQEVEKYLEPKDLKFVPNLGEVRQVVGVSNIGVGGARFNIKHNIPTFMKELAVEVSKIINLPVCGVDFMIERMPVIKDSSETLSAKIIEVNSCPSLAMYEDIDSPEQKELIDRYLDSLL